MGTDPESGRLAASAESLELELTPRFAGRLRVYAARRLWDRAAAEEVAQEVLRRVIEALREGRLEKPESLAGFVYATAQHVCLLRLRSAGREARALQRVALDRSGSAAAADPLAELIAGERIAALRRGLEKLAGGDRELLRMIYFEYLESREVARRLAVSEGALRVRKHRALKRLAELVAEDPGGNEAAPAAT